MDQEDALKKIINACLIPGFVPRQDIDQVALPDVGAVRVIAFKAERAKYVGDVIGKERLIHFPQKLRS
jgi:hypothetical protein